MYSQQQNQFNQLNNWQKSLHSQILRNLIVSVSNIVVMLINAHHTKFVCVCVLVQVDALSIRHVQPALLRSVSPVPRSRVVTRFLTCTKLARVKLYGSNHVASLYFSTTALKVVCSEKMTWAYIVA